MNERRIYVGVTGASGSVYAERLIDCLLASEAKQHIERVYLSVTDAGQKVVRHELEKKSEGFSLLAAANGELAPTYREHVRLFAIDDFFAPIASGSSAPTDMVIVPCSMGTLARVAHGASSNLIERSADVVLKQKHRLIICPRESPLNSIHLRNMLSLSDLGAYIVPPMPAFYNQPRSLADSIDFVVGRILEVLALPHGLYKPWNSRMR